MNRYVEIWNIMLKINTNVFNSFIPDLIKKISINKNITLKKLPTSVFLSNISKNNEKLFDMKIKDIISEHPMGTKYSTFDRFENKRIIEKIYRENKEINVIKILELTFEKLLILYKRSLKDRSRRYEKIRRN